MAWRIEFDRRAEKELSKLHPDVAGRILRFLRDRVSRMENPRSIGEALKGAELGEFWKYRVGDFRIIVRIEDERVTVLVLRIGDRKEIYR